MYFSPTHKDTNYSIWTKFGIYYMYQQKGHSTTFEAFISIIFDQNLIKLWQGGPLDLRDSKNGQKLGIYRMYQQNEHHFEGLYLSHFCSELNKTWTGWSSGYQELKVFIRYQSCFYNTTTTFSAPWRLSNSSALSSKAIGVDTYIFLLYKYVDFFYRKSFQRLLHDVRLNPFKSCLRKSQ